MPQQYKHSTLHSHLQPTLQNFLSLGPTNSAVNSNLFISADPKGTHCVAGCNSPTQNIFKKDRKLVL